MTHHHIAVSFTQPEKMQAAEKLAAQLKLPLLTLKESRDAGYDYLLVYTENYLGLHQKGAKFAAPFHIDFLSPKLLYREQHASLKKELLARAIGVHPRENPVIIDTTAGLGRDSFILASLGFQMTLLERSPILHALLSDAMTRASKHPGVKRMQLELADSIDWLAHHRADIVYLDPMFPERQKSASVKKEMVILQDLLGNDEDAETLLNAALTCASRRVVVKRPRLAETISSKQPHFNLTGKSSRFDIYLTQLKG
jgi:16S rRNA (guanine1516-N2)-methyltransferase